MSQSSAIYMHFCGEKRISCANILCNSEKNCEIEAKIDTCIIFNFENFVDLMECNLTAEFDCCEFSNFEIPCTSAF